MFQEKFSIEVSKMDSFSYLTFSISTLTFFSLSREGYSSVEEFRQAKLKEASDIVAKARAEAASAVATSSTSTSSQSSTPSTSTTSETLTQDSISTSTSQAKSETTEERDSRVAREIRARAEAEARRKLQSGELGSGPGGKSPVKVSGD